MTNVPAPTITSATYDFNTNTMTVTGTGFVKSDGAANDIDLSDLTITGEGGETYTLTTATDVEITSGTQFSFTLSGTDLISVERLLNKNGTAADGGTTYNLAGAAGFVAGDATNAADATAGIDVTYAAPAITSATYDYGTNTLVVTGTNFVDKTGAANDVDVSKLTFTGEGGATYTLTSATDVEITSDTQFTVTLSDADVVNVEALLNKDGTSANNGTTLQPCRRRGLDGRKRGGDQRRRHHRQTASR